MAASDSTTNPKKFMGRESTEAMGFLFSKISQIKGQIQDARFTSIKGKLRKNEKSLDFSTSQLCELSKSIKDLHSVEHSDSKNMLSSRIENPICKLSGYAHGSEEKDIIHNQEYLPSSTIKLPFVDKIPPYTTWIFLDKNQRMPEDQSVVGRRQIYYDQNCGETLISSDSEEEAREPEELQHAFSEGEDQLLRIALQEHGISQEVLDVLSQFIGVSSSEIQGRYNYLIEKYQEQHVEKAEGSMKNDNVYLKGIVLDKDLDAALDSFDNLFCRRCLVFDCRLHGCSQNIVTPCEKQPCISELGENGKPCSDQCYIWKHKVDETLSGCVWEPIEKDLYLKGMEIFGKNSCLITRNLLSGLKTCNEVYNYMFKDGDSMLRDFSSLPNSGMRGDGTADNDNEEQEIPMKSRLFRRRGKARKLKYTWKSSGHPSIRKRIADGKNRLLKQYTPCGCDSTCGKQCPCVENETCCEKYCGCSKICKNRFRGCHCAKSQCRSRQCPCFAANRECDPDVCRNCWVSCGDGSLGEPPARGDGYQCGNMKLLLKQQQRILLSKSSVAGWGAFIKNPVNKNDYLGEYTGEIISQKEADKRGKIYDRANSSFLFDLNDQYVLDACRKGDKLKFANHSSTPNCFAKVMMVAGDHRVGIFAKERIEASEELFYDYFYGPDQAPLWARKPEGSKRDDSLLPHGRARKHQSH